MSLSKGIGVVFMGTGGIIMAILGMAIYIWSIVISYAFGGLIAAIFTLAIPVAGQIYWFFKIWYLTGTIINAYCLATIGYVVSLGLIIVGVAMMER